MFDAPIAKSEGFPVHPVTLSTKFSPDRQWKAYIIMPLPLDGDRDWQGLGKKGTNPRLPRLALVRLKSPLSRGGCDSLDGISY
ncbi:MAG: hypothetical protein SVX43_21000, partial [Cyanobacteriota bacterium]|nr:hypothetical protein [Cyanobacteriota bacterium]